MQKIRTIVVVIGLLLGVLALPINAAAQSVPDVHLVGPCDGVGDSPLVP